MGELWEPTLGKLIAGDLTPEGLYSQRPQTDGVKVVLVTMKPGTFNLCGI